MVRTRIGVDLIDRGVAIPSETQLHNSKVPRLKLSVVIRVFLCDFGYGETRDSQGKRPCLGSNVLVHPWGSMRHGSGDTEVAKKLCSQTHNTEVATRRWPPVFSHFGG